MNSPTIVMLGASVDQLPSYRVARDMNYYIISFDGNPDAFAFPLANETYPVSVRDHQQIEKILNGRQVDAIYSPASDAARLSEYHLAKAFKTPKRVSMDSVRGSVSKSFFLHKLQCMGLPHHAHIRGNDLAELANGVNGWSYPFVVKPNDSSGSKGVRVVRSAAELGRALEQARSISPTQSVVCEELVVGMHCSVDVFLRDSRVEFMAVAQKMMTSEPFMIPLHYVMPAEVREPVRDSIKEYVERICKGLDIVSGPITCDVVVRDADEAVYFIEMGARAAGNGISMLMNHAYGIDYIDASLGVHLGKSVSVKPKFHKHVALMTVASGAAGVMQKVSGVDVLLEDGVIVDCKMFYSPGQFVKKFEEASHKLGYLVLEGDSPEEIGRKMESVGRVLDIRVESKNAFLSDTFA